MSLSCGKANEKLQDEVSKRDTNIEKLQSQIQQMQKQHDTQIHNLREMHRQELDMKDDILRVENDPDDESRLNLTINRKPIADWFREQWHRLRYGTRLSQQEEKKSRGLKM